MTNEKKCTKEFYVKQALVFQICTPKIAFKISGGCEYDWSVTVHYSCSILRLFSSYYATVLHCSENFFFYQFHNK